MSLQAALEAIALEAPDHVIGVAVTDVAEDRLIAALNPARPFQLASMFKLAVLVAAFRRVDAGELALETRCTVQASDRLVGSGILSFLDVGLQPTLRDLLRLMIIVSDNTATDMVLERLGGPAAVDAVLRELGIEDMHVRHRTRDLLWAVFPSDELALTDAEFARIRREHHLTVLLDEIAPNAATNTGTPLALNALLVKIARGECASAESTAAMLAILQQQTFNHRLPRHWPEETIFAHKTGTLADMRGDAGVVWLAGHTLAVSAIVQAVGVPLPLTPTQQDAGDALLARVGRAVYDWAKEDPAA